jgi:hypothetical protein
MTPLPDVAYLLAAALLANATPHLVSGRMGRPFQSPFAKPPGEGLSSSTVNVLWGFANLAVGYGLIAWVGAPGRRRAIAYERSVRHAPQALFI